MGSTGIRSVRVAGLLAGELLTDKPFRTSGLALATERDALHPDLVRTRRGLGHITPLSIGAGGPLAVLAVDLDADRGLPARSDALPTFGTRAAFARRQAGGAFESVAAKESFGATPRLVQPAGAATPSLAE
jgi:hypothetical protein